MQEHNSVKVPNTQVNPFAITKAVDFTDVQITRNWVDWPLPGGFADWLNVNSPMPRVIVGGKGTGRTHLMRHFSASVQSIRGDGDSLSQVIDDGILGIYVLCSGINASRFSGRGRDRDAWRSIFAYYMDLWLAQASLAAFAKVTEQHSIGKSTECLITKDILSIFHTDFAKGSDWSIRKLQNKLFELQARIDKAVNNAALNPESRLDVEILANPGQLVFGIPIAIQRHSSKLRDILFLYLIDEFENFRKDQQRYVNSLIREKVPGTSFIVGVRSYGVRTYSTLTSGEQNRRGSEFEEIRQDRKYVDRNWDQYGQFCRRVVTRRLTEHHLVDEADFAAVAGDLDTFFEIPSTHLVEESIVSRFPPTKRPCLERLADDLRMHGRGSDGQAISQDDIHFIVSAVSVPSRPLLEKVNAFLLYRAWYRGLDLIDAACQLTRHGMEAGRSETVSPNDKQKSVLQHFGTDIGAQLYRDAKMPVYYAGMGEFITMSDGLPRNLLVMLKNIWRWARFYGEKPFAPGHKFSLACQRRGVLETADWFYEDSRPLGDKGEHVQSAIARLGELLRSLRYSRKPSESSCASFSADLSACSRRAADVVRLAERWALLIEVDRGQRERNSGMTEPKFHLNRLLSPRWDLPTARRGAVHLSSKEMNAIFDPDMSDQFESVVSVRLSRMNPPFRRGRPSNTDVQGVLDLEG